MAADLELSAELAVESTAAEHTRCRQGLLFGIGAYGLWGLIPLYFKAVGHVSPVEVLAQRVLWSFLFLAILLSLSQRWRKLGQALRSPRVMRTLAVTTTLIGFNWLVYIYSVSTDQVLQASLGYFITPLANVLLGVLFLRERLRPHQLLGVFLATVGVVALAVLGGGFPWIALFLAVTFAFYGLLRKTVAADGLLGLSIETLLLLPLSVGYIAYLHATEQAAFATSGPLTPWLLALSGIITAVPLLMFAAAARRLRLATLGMLQYLAPTVQFLLAVLAFGEPFSTPQLASFACIWAAVAVYSADFFLRRAGSEVGRDVGC